jgi:mRNA-degrading endonuclease YafQ of YafQ-DinJ toxin-antitoxin module
MELLYAKKFSKDVDKIQTEASTKRSLLKVIEKIREAGSMGEINGIKKIEPKSCN